MKKDKLLQHLLERKEGQNFECKRALTKPRKLLETAVALANAGGGILVIGMEDPSKADKEKRFIGTNEDTDGNLSEFKKQIEKEINPPTQHTIDDIKITNAEGLPDNLTVVQFEKSKEIHSLKSGDTLIRRGTQNTKIGAQEIIRLQYEKGVKPFEGEETDITTLEDLDINLLKEYVESVQSENKDNIPQFLKDSGLAKQYKESFRLTKAGVLLFGKNPSILLGSKCEIKISHYYGTERTYSEKPNFVRRPFSIEGPLLQQIKKTVAYFHDFVKTTPPELQGATFNPKQTLLIPEQVFHEAVTNAVIHRNYFIEDDIQIRFFDDRIEVESPGTYPGHITPSNIRDERFARNPTIQKTLNRFNKPPNLDIGEGVDRMFETMKRNNLYNPVYEQPHIRPNSVLLYLLNLHKVEYWDTVSKYLDENNTITNSEARRITGVGDTLKMSRLLKEWTDNKLLERLGKSNQDAHYKKTTTEVKNLLFSKPHENE